LILRWEDFLRPDRDAPEQSADLEGPQTICNYTSFFVFVKSPQQLFCPFSSALWIWLRHNGFCLELRFSQPICRLTSRLIIPFISIAPRRPSLPPHAILCLAWPTATPAPEQVSNSRRHILTVGTSVLHRTRSTRKGRQINLNLRPRNQEDL